MPLPYFSERTLAEKITNFPKEVYSFEPTTHLYKLMHTLLQDSSAGIGTWLKYQSVARLSESLATTSFSDLDNFFGGMIHLERLLDEVYTYDPFADQLTQEQWDEIDGKDASYRSRIQLFLSSLLRGGTNEGLAMAASAACGLTCAIVEMWRVTSGAGLGLTLGRTPALNAAKELVVLPMTDAANPFTLSQERAILHVVSRLKPVNTFVTVYEGALLPQTLVTIRWAMSSSVFYEVTKFVRAPTGKAAVNRLPDSWLDASRETQAPLHAYIRTQDTQWTLNGSVSQISSYRVDPSYPLQIGTLDTSTDASQTTIIVDEVLTPPTNSFKILIDNEVMWVTTRVPTTTANQYSYTVLRSQDGTVAAAHNAVGVKTSYLAFGSSQSLDSQQFGPWREIEKADSPDNFPLGQNTGDPGRYDGSGNYIFAWASQAEFTQWFTQEITNIGGVVQGNQYQLPITFEPLPGLISMPSQSLANPQLIVRSRYFPELI